jgi:hypothetical protein
MEFYKTFIDMDSEEKLKTLKSITIDETNKKRKINSKVADNIVKFMF